MKGWELLLLLIFITPSLKFLDICQKCLSKSDSNNTFKLKIKHIKKPVFQSPKCHNY